MAFPINILLFLNNIVVRCIKCWFECVTVKNRKFTEHHKSCSRFLLFFICKFAIIELKQLVTLTKHIGDHPNQIIVFVVHEIILGRDTSIHKDITFSKVTMHVTENYYLILSELLYKVLAVIYFWMKQLRRLAPSTIKIDTKCITSVIPSYHSIRVQHGYYLKHKLLSKELSFLSLSQKTVDWALYHKRWIAFPRVDTTS